MSVLSHSLPSSERTYFSTKEVILSTSYNTVYIIFWYRLLGVAQIIPPPPHIRIIPVVSEQLGPHW